MAYEEGQGHERFVFRFAEKGSDGKYRGQDSNLHTKRHLNLNQACLPISPPRRDRKRVPPDSSFSSRIRRSSILTLREEFFRWLRSIFEEFADESQTCSATYERRMVRKWDASPPLFSAVFFKGAIF